MCPILVDCPLTSSRHSSEPVRYWIKGDPWAFGLRTIRGPYTQDRCPTPTARQSNPSRDANTEELRRCLLLACFTALRLTAGAVVLSGLALARGGTQLLRAGTWISAAALFTYAAGFSFAYLTLPTGTGALLLFSAVQGSMIGGGLWRGEGLRPARGRSHRDERG